MENASLQNKFNGTPHDVAFTVTASRPIPEV